MNICPNCLKKLNENFVYCNECECKVDEETKGDFKTNFLNVFKINHEFIYLFAVHGHQVVLKSDSVDELEELVILNKFPWREFENNFLTHEPSLVDNLNEEYAIIGVSTLERNPAYSNLDKLFK